MTENTPLRGLSLSALLPLSILTEQGTANRDGAAMSAASNAHRDLTLSLSKDFAAVEIGQHIALASMNERKQLVAVTAVRYTVTLVVPIVDANSEGIIDTARQAFTDSILTAAAVLNVPGVSIIETALVVANYDRDEPPQARLELVTPSGEKITAADPGPAENEPAPPRTPPALDGGPVREIKPRKPSPVQAFTGTDDGGPSAA